MRVHVPLGFALGDQVKCGGEVASRLYSLILSCKHADVDPEAYIEDVLMRVLTTPAREAASLTPCAWASVSTVEAASVN